jgi:hypothetical protein
MIGHYDRKWFADAQIIVGFDEATGAEVWVQDDKHQVQLRHYRTTVDIYCVPISGDNAAEELLALLRQVKGPGYSIQGKG